MPVPFDGPALATLIHDSCAAADHSQPVIAVTRIVATPPLAWASIRVWSRSNVHGTPSWVTSSCVDSTASVPRREKGVPFAVMVNGTVDAPWPLDRAGTIQGAVGLMLHVHSRAPVTARLPDPAVYGNDVEERVAETSHFAAGGAVIELEDDVHPLRKRTSPAIGARRIRTAAQRASGLPVAAVYVRNGTPNFSDWNIKVRQMSCSSARASASNPRLASTKQSEQMSDGLIGRKEMQALGL